MLAAKAMVIKFINYCGVVYTHTIPHDQTVNVAYYIAVLKQLMKDHNPKKSPEYVGKSKLHRDNP